MCRLGLLVDNGYASPVGLALQFIVDSEPFRDREVNFRHHYHHHDATRTLLGHGNLKKKAMPEKPPIAGIRIHYGPLPTTESSAKRSSALNHLATDD